MFQDNFRTLRKQKGFTQESLAIQLHVVRQTVSKWEKGLSVPDAEMLQRIAEVLEVDVGQLLGGALPKDGADRGDIVEQLSRINEQLAVRNRRSRRIWRGVAVALILLIAVPALLAVLGIVNYGAVGSREPAGSVAWACALDGETYLYQVEYDKRYRVLSAGGDAWIAEQASLESCGDANLLAEQLESYVAGHGGTVTVTEAEGLELDREQGIGSRE